MKLAKELDGLPLALATAGAYLDQVATSFADYLRLYKASWLKLQHTSPKLSSYEDQALYSTWQLSLDHIKRQNELSAWLLQLWAYFDNQDIWFELLQHSISDGPEWFSQLTKDELSFNQAVRVLCDYGLAEVDISSEESGVESKGYSMHSCVHSWTIHFLNQEWDVRMAGLALECVGSHVPDKAARKAWVTQWRLIRHAVRCWHFVENGIISEDGIEGVLGSLGNLYLYQGKLGEAEKMYKRALQGKEKALGPEHTSTLDTVNNLGSLYKNQGELGETEKMYERALQGYEKALGPEHTSTLDTVNNLGNLYAVQGKLGEAEKMYGRALQGYEEALGHEGVNTYIPALNATENFAMLCAEMGRADKAGDMYSRALCGLEAVLGRSSKRCQDIIADLAALAALNGDRR
jgi:tetratricopeptide (TPR) repeat protein